MMRFSTMVTAVLLSGSGFAATESHNDFSGFSTSAGVGIVGASAHNYYTPSPRTDAQNPRLGNVVMQALVDASYTKALMPNYFLGIGGMYDFSDTQDGAYYSYQSGVAYSNDVRSKEHYAIYLQPAYLLNDTTVAFAKLGYHSTVLKNIDRGSFYTNPYSEKARIGGVGYGLGLKTFIYKNIFLQTEGQLVRYFTHKKSTPTNDTYGSIASRLSMVSGIVSVGAQF